jgi:curved DNA-binding protein CbpA
MTEVKKAWRIRSRQAHPDAPGGEAEDFMTLKSAYEKIMEQKRPPAGRIQQK